MDTNKTRNSDECCDQMEKRKNDINHQNSSQDHVRFYICSFCMRGFSNAQALGGHMNIHRRDRAKLRQLLQDKDDDLDEQHDDDLVCDNEIKACPNDKLGFHQKLDAAENVVELPDFIGMASQMSEEERSKEFTDASGCDRNKKEISEVLRDGSSSSYREIEGLDLELRLGQSLKNTSDMRKL